MQAHHYSDSNAMSSSSFMSPSPPFPTVDPIIPPPSPAEPHLILGEMLNDIAKTASSAGDACRMGQNEEASNKVDELKLRILKVSEMLAIMSVNNAHFLPPSFPQFVAIPDHLSLPFHQSLSSCDISRKRGPSDMEEQRTTKALKREPHEDPSLVFATTDSVIPSSRPTTPPSTFLIDSVKQRPPLLTEYSAFLPPTQPTIDFGSGITTPMASASPTFSDFHTPWCDAVVHPLPLQVLPVPSSNPPPIAVFSATSEPVSQQQEVDDPSQPAGTQFNFSYLNPYPESWAGSTASASNPVPPEPVPTVWHPEATTTAIPNSPVSSEAPTTRPSTTRATPTDDEDEGNSSSDGGDSIHSKTDKILSLSSEIPPTGSDIPHEYRIEVDRIFFEFLNRICSNLDATDSKGEPIHQTLMAKKMQRLDESPDFRPFKFRIQAFTLAFLEELARQGYPEEKIPMKRIRNYLWRQPFILRFNEDGKKAKSKGNHIWNIEAKKAGDGKWEFRPFYRKLAGNPPSVAYCGLKWSWTPRVWDPQASFQNVPVKYTSPSLPSWLSWKEDVLSGVPPPDAEDSTITINATYILDGQEGQLSHTFTITIAPVSAAVVAEASHPRPRRPSMAGDAPRRSASDSYLCQTSKRAKARSNTTAASTAGYVTNKVAAVPTSASDDSDADPTAESPDKRVIRVLQHAAHKVLMEAESELVSYIPKQETLEDLAKQKQVLELTVDAYDRELSGQTHSQTRRLAVAAQHVVVQAAHTVIADKSGGTVVPESEVTAIQSVTVNELSDATQDAIAEAVKMKGTATNDVDIIVTATSILKARAPGSPTTSLEALPSQSSTPPSPTKVITSSLSSSPGAASSRVNISPGYTPNLSSLPEYV